MFCQYLSLKRDSSPKYINSFIIYSCHSKPITFSFFCGISKIYIFRNFGYYWLEKNKKLFQYYFFLCVCVFIQVWKYMRVNKWLLLFLIYTWIICQINYLDFKSKSCIDVYKNNRTWCDCNLSHEFDVSASNTIHIYFLVIKGIWHFKVYSICKV